MKKKNLSRKGFSLRMKKRSKNIVRKRNYKPIGFRENPQCNFPDIHANIFQGEEVNIPEDVLIKVLSRLPLKNRARLKCVSKQWQHLISNHVPLANSPRLLFSNSNNSYSLRHKFFTIDNETRVQKVYLPIEKHLSWKLNVHSSCHGLVLIQIDNNLYLWNPLTSFFRKVLTIDGFFHEPDLVDLCFCSINDEYKVVLLGNRSHFWRSQKLYVATCGDNNWEKIENVEIKDPGPFFKGYRHWISHNYKDLTHGVIAFDPSTNKLIDLATPQPKEGVKQKFLALGVLDECLSMTRIDVVDNDKGKIEFLLMKEYRNVNSWEVMFVFPYTHSDYPWDTYRPLFRTKKGGLLVRRNYKLKTYDDRGNFLKNIWNWTQCNPRDVICYEESWSSPTNIKSCD